MKHLFNHFVFAGYLFLSGSLTLQGQGPLLEGGDDMAPLRYSERINTIRTASFRNDEFGPLDSITIFNNLKGEQVSVESFQYDPSGRVVRREVTYSDSYPRDLLETIRYPEKDTLLIRTASERMDASVDWEGTYRFITVLEGNQKIRFITLEWVSSVYGWIPYTSTEETYDIEGRLDTRIHSGYQIAQGKWVPVKRERLVYNPTGLIKEFWTDVYSVSSGNWNSSKHKTYIYSQDSILQDVYWRNWYGSSISWQNVQWEHWDHHQAKRLSIRQVAQIDLFSDDWIWIIRQDYYTDSLDRNIAIVNYMDCWPDSLQPIDSLVLTYDDIGRIEEETLFKWDISQWTPFSVHRFGREQCPPYVGILDSIWRWEELPGIWDLQLIESCHQEPDQNIIEVDSVRMFTSWNPLDMTVRYYYADPSAKPEVQDNPIALQACLFENPYSSGGLITCFTDAAYQGQTMNLSLVTLTGQVIHEGQYPAGQPFVLPPFIGPGMYVLHVSLSGGKSFSVKLQIHS